MKQPTHRRYAMLNDHFTPITIDTIESNLRDKKFGRSAFSHPYRQSVVIDRLKIQQDMARNMVKERFPSCKDVITTDEQKNAAIAEIIASGIEPMKARELVKLVMSPEMVKIEVEKMAEVIKRIETLEKEKK